MLPISKMNYKLVSIKQSHFYETVDNSPPKSEVCFLEIRNDAGQSVESRFINQINRYHPSVATGYIVLGSTTTVVERPGIIVPYFTWPALNNTTATSTPKKFKPSKDSTTAITLQSGSLSSSLGPENKFHFRQRNNTLMLRRKSISIKTSEEEQVMIFEDPSNSSGRNVNTPFPVHIFGSFSKASGKGSINNFTH